MMASTLRTARSNAAPVAPAGRGSDGAARPAALTASAFACNATSRALMTAAPLPAPRPAARPQLHVIDGSSQRNGSRSTGSLARIIAWTQARGASLIHVTVAIVFLVATLLITLMLRTQMVQNSFESNTVQNNINMLTQDVQDDQAKLDELISSLPDKAQKMGMVPQQDSVTIDLNGYKPSKGSAQ